MDALLKYNIDNSKREKHNAVIDCELLSKVYINLLGQKEPTLQLSVDQAINHKVSDKGKINYFNQVVKPTDEDLILHKNFKKRNKKKFY